MAWIRKVWTDLRSARQSGRNTGTTEHGAAEYFALGVAHHTAERWAEARSAYLQALALNPKHAKAQHNLGTVLQQTGDIAGAIAALERSIELAPAAVAHSNLAAALAIAGDLDAAEAICRKGLALDDASAHIHNNLGQILIMRGQLDSAERHCTRALELDPNFKQASFILALVFFETGRTEQSIELLRSMVARFPDDRYLHSRLLYVCCFRTRSIRLICATSISPGRDGT